MQYAVENMGFIMSGAGLLGVAVFSTIRPLSRYKPHNINTLNDTVCMQEV